ncbi:hypothetical protein Taro_023584 [Colocasia esculenta]|uniref:Uncharacterized protein n=1 Tax=Colocasia esculenta TaxID=4460 RepID=A0A843VHS4_COLES|nr:hypothetical protein [Colocasia esculenta]
MCLVFVCDEEETVLGSQPAPGCCPYCGGMVVATDVESQWRFCFLPLCFRSKRRVINQERVFYHGWPYFVEEEADPNLFRAISSLKALRSSTKNEKA